MQVYLAYHRSIKDDCDDEVWVGWLLYIHSRGKVLDIPARKMNSVKRNADDVQVRELLRALPFKFRSGPRKTPEEAHSSEKAINGTFTGFTNPAEDVPIV